MALETVTHINDLVVTNPTSTDPASQGDDHIRNIKRAIKQTFPSITGPVTLTQAAINALPTDISTVNTNLNNAKADKTINLTAGDGLSGGGTLAANRTFAVDGSVVRTSGAQTIAGVKTFSDSPTVTPNNRMSMPFSGGATKELQYTGAAIGFYDRTNLRWDLLIDANGNLTPRGTMDASNVSGTLADARIPTSIVRTSRTLTGGDGITTNIGDLSANRTISVDSSVVRTTRNLVAGDGLTGGGTLAADRTFAVDSSVVRTSRTLTGGDGINTIGDLSANRTISVDSSVVRTTRNLVAGNGLTGGGTLAGDRTFALGTPGSITATSVNEVTATSHTHALTSGTVRTLYAEAGINNVGTYAFLRHGTGTSTDTVTPGETRAGSTLYYSCASTGNNQFASSPRPSGTWRSMGFSNHQQDGTLWEKIA